MDTQHQYHQGAIGLAQSHMYSLLLGPGAYKVLFMSPRVASLFPPVLWKFCNQIPLAFRVIAWDSQSLCQMPRLRSLMWDLEPSQQCEDFFGTIALQVVGGPPGRNGI